MDAVSPSSSMPLRSLQPRNALSKVPIFQRLTPLTTLIPSWVCSTKPKTTLSPVSSKSPFFLRCSTKPDTSANSETQHNNPNNEPNSLSHYQNAPSSSEAFSSSPAPLQQSPHSSSSRGLVFELGPSNSWDSADIGSPVVKRFLSDEEERWYMWYHGRAKGHPSCDLVGLAISSNGVHWERGGGPARASSDVGFVMSCGKDWWGFDTGGIRPSEMVIMSSSRVRASSAVYWLYYTGFGSDRLEFSDHTLEFTVENPDCGNGKVLKSLPGLAISQDGRHWARIEGEHHSGALIDVGSEKEWDSLFISSPQVVYHGNGDLRMYYHSFDVERGHFGVGIARSRDGIRWVKLGKIMGGGKGGSFDEFGVMNACVTRNRSGGNYVMAYEGVAADGRRSIGVAVSPDGLKEWVRLQDEVVLEPSDLGCWDDKGVGSPCLVEMDTEGNEWRLYYRGVGNGGRVGIGMAVSEEYSSTKEWNSSSLFHCPSFWVYVNKAF
ncbi:hypothetical protein CR513_28919, partial [Mucuna pruriens]